MAGVVQELQCSVLCMLMCISCSSTYAVNVNVLCDQGQPRTPAGAPWAFGKLLQQQQGASQPQPAAEQQQQHQQQQHQKPRALIQEVSDLQQASQDCTDDVNATMLVPDALQSDTVGPYCLNQPDRHPAVAQNNTDICARIEALEQSSKRIEHKVDQILRYCCFLSGRESM